MISVYTIEQNEKWDNIVRSFKEYDSYWLSGYTKAFQIHGDGTPLLFYYEDSTSRGINVVMKRDIAEDAHFCDAIQKDCLYDISTPYGYGGWIIEGEVTEKIFSEYEDWCKTNNIVSEFVRFHPIVCNHNKLQKQYDIVQLGNVVAMDLSSRETIWENLTSKNRNMIRKAQKSGIRIYHGRYPEIFEKFEQIYNGTMDRDNAQKYYYFEKDFYMSICEDMPENVQVFYAVKDERIIAASIMLIANKMMNYHLSGSIKEFSGYAPTNLILYEAALWGAENGCKTLYLGGGVGSKEDGLLKFKKAFYRWETLPHFYIGKKIFNQEAYDELVAIRGEINGNFFPAYRG